MNETSFNELKMSLEDAMLYVRELQAIHRDQTGQDFVMPLRLPEGWIAAQRQLDRDETRNHERGM